MSNSGEKNRVDSTNKETPNKNENLAPTSSKRRRRRKPTSYTGVKNPKGSKGVPKSTLKSRERENQSASSEKKGGSRPPKSSNQDGKLPAELVKRHKSSEGSVKNKVEEEHKVITSKDKSNTNKKSNNTEAQSSPEKKNNRLESLPKRRHQGKQHKTTSSSPSSSKRSVPVPKSTLKKRIEREEEAKKALEKELEIEHNEHLENGKPETNKRVIILAIVSFLLSGMLIFSYTNLSKWKKTSKEQNNRIYKLEGDLNKSQNELLAVQNKIDENNDKSPEQPATEKPPPNWKQNFENQRTVIKAQQIELKALTKRLNQRSSALEKASSKQIKCQDSITKLLTGVLDNKTTSKIYNKTLSICKKSERAFYSYKRDFSE